MTMQPADRKLAHQALTAITETTKGNVYGSRKGICAGVKLPKMIAVTMFRRVNGRVQMESRLAGSFAGNVKVFRLEPDQETWAAAMLDNL